MTRYPHRGFTLVELLLVMFLIALLASLVMPVATKSVEQAKESALKEDLQVLRKAIDAYYANTGHYPESLSQLADKRYIRRLPVDPLTERANSWIEVPGDEAGGGIIEVHSSAEGNGADGVPYRDW
ncbi:MAG: prepilin-type N-terminal cleavage/methylation domain-containing protein [Gallionellaceae bacterium]